MERRRAQQVSSSRRRVAGNAALLFGTIVVLAGLLEGGFRLIAPRRGDWFAAGPERIEFLREHVRRNTDGFRDREFSRARTPGVVRLLAVGDSFTFGDGIARVDDTWPRVLETTLRKAGLAAEVLNLGVPGVNTAFERRMLLEKGYPLEPDRIVLAFVLNDPEAPGANRDAIPARVFLPLLPWRGLDGRLTRASYAYSWLRGKKNQILERLGRKESYEQYVRGLYEPGASWEAFVREARGLVQDAHERGVAVTVAVFPLFHDLEAEPFRGETARAASVFREEGADVIDLMDAYRGRPTSALSISSTDAHPNEEAHRLAGQAIARHLLDTRGSGPMGEAAGRLVSPAR